MNPSNLIESYEDPTGSMSQEQINAANISNLMDAVNGLQASTGNIINQPTYIEVNDGTSNRVLMGYNQTTRTWGLFTTPPGTSIEDATMPQQFSSSSDYSSLVIVTSGTISLSQGLTTGTTGLYLALFGQTVKPHGLPYTPVVQASMLFGSTYIPLPYPAVDNISSSSVAWVTYYCSTDATNIYFTYQGVLFGNGTLAGATLTAQYNLLQVTA